MAVGGDGQRWVVAGGGRRGGEVRSEDLTVDILVSFPGHLKGVSVPQTRVKRRNIRTALHAPIAVSVHLEVGGGVSDGGLSC